jgi:uncharacterized membrane protein YfbV (UPF0208 family)
MMREPSLELALTTLRPGASWITRNGVIEWLDEHQTQPLEEEIQVEMQRLQEKYDRIEYQRKRIEEYPNIRELADSLYWNSKGDTSKLEEYYSKCEKVKNKYPKPQ